MLLPVALNVQGKRCLIVGGGRVAARKVQSLLECGAHVTIIAPELCSALLAIPDAIEWLPRPFQEGDCTGFELIFACTDQRTVNELVADEAKREKIWCSIADDAVNSDFHGAAAVRRGGICIGIMTEAGSPALARHLKNEIENCISAEYATLLEMVAARRTEMDRLPAEQAARAALWQAILQSDVLPLLRAGRRIEAETLVDALIDANDRQRETGAGI